MTFEIGGSTSVTYPSGAVTGVSHVLTTVPVAGGTGVIVAETPFHPLDHTWPDQPADEGWLTVRDEPQPVADCLTGAVEKGSGTIYVGEDIPVRRGAAGWHWLVMHVVEKQVRAGAMAELNVEPNRRRALSAGHTACHLAALALNAALAGRWRKDGRGVRTDTLGNPDFDQTAIATSRVVAYGSRDTYRLGRSLRRAGFTTEGLDEALPEIAEEVEARLRTWVAADAPVWVEVPSPELHARRVWHCALPEGTAGIPCGGTHLTGTGELGEVGVLFELSGEADELVMRTVVRAPEAT